jgi:RNA polymerase sigma-70 factor (ECF subfamily)
MPRIRVVEQAPSEGSNDVDVQIVASSSSTEDEAIRREAARALAHAVRVLAPDEATVLVLARIEGLSYDDIAFVIGRSATATKQLAYRALKRVRAELTAAGHGEGS